jgi:hypothetical protein
MPRMAVDVLEWTEIVGSEDDGQSMGPEDYAWLAQAGRLGIPERLPNLAWISDRSERERVDQLIARAFFQPAGSA